VSSLLIGILSAFLAWADAGAFSNAAVKAALAPAGTTDQKDPVEMAYQKLLEEDDAAQEEADKWIKEADAFRIKGAPLSDEKLNLRIEQRFAPVRKAYEDFLQLHPNHTRAHLAFGSFLYETKDEEEGVAQWEKARQLDPKNPAAWNNLANHFGHRGPVEKAFEYYAKAIELDPEEPVYLQNLATTTYLFRKDAMEHYKIEEKQVFDRSLELYRKALKLDPKNFPLATDYAQTYYGIKPLRTQEALAAWNEALEIANDDFEREGVFIHLARVELNSGLFAQARKHLDMVTNSFYTTLKSRLNRNLIEKESKATNTATQESSGRN
jgi:tetratricopeptide (TPR) repeat protein